MSTPVTPGSSQESSENVDKRCDFLSEDFDPLAALTTLDDSYVPSPEIAPFNNLEEYTNAVRGLTAAQRKKKTAASKSSSSSSKPSERQWERIIKPDVLEQAGIVRNEDIAKSMMIKGKTKMKKDIFQRLEGLSLSSGPQSVLHKAMRERIQVKVWTRSARQLRGFSVGFILAFDKHWNLAMVDVDETYCQPSLPRTSFTLPKQVMLQRKREQKLKEQGSSRPTTPVLGLGDSKGRPMTPVLSELKGRPTTPVLSESKGRPMTPVLSESNGRPATPVLSESKGRPTTPVLVESKGRPTTPVLVESKGRPTTPLPTETKSRPTTPLPTTSSETDSARIKIVQEKSRDSPQPFEHTTSHTHGLAEYLSVQERLKSAASWTQPHKNVDSQLITRTVSKLPASDKSKGSSKESDNFVVPGSKGYGDTSKLKTLPRFPRGIEIKEKIPGLQGRIFVRHLNQLFVRGDNVVMVQLLS